MNAEESRYWTLEDDDPDEYEDWSGAYDEDRRYDLEFVDDEEDYSEEPIPEESSSPGIESEPVPELKPETTAPVPAAPRKQPAKASSRTGTRKRTQASPRKAKKAASKRAARKTRKAAPKKAARKVRKTAQAAVRKAKPRAKSTRAGAPARGRKAAAARKKKATTRKAAGARTVPKRKSASK